MTRDSCVFYASWLSAMEKMPEKIQGEAALAILRYAIKGLDTSDSISPFAYAMLKTAAPLIEKNNQRYINSKSGGRKPKRNQNETKTQTNVNDNVNDNVNVKKESIEKKVAAAPAPQQRMVKPSVVDVADYAAKMGYTGFHTERFYSYYESNGWRVGKNPMKDWKAAVRNWHQRDLQEKQPSRKLTYDELHPIGDFSHEFTSI